MLDTTQAIDYCRPSDPCSLAGVLGLIWAAIASTGERNVRRMFGFLPRAQLTSAHVAA